MRAGRLRHRVTVQAFTELGVDAVGTPQGQWDATAIDVAAEVTPLSGSELLAAQQVGAETTHVVRMRYGTTVTPRHRLLFGARILEIESAPNVEERNKELLLRCREAEVKDDA
jgi:SPP1 family predicted phage head-tail adaptor